MLSFKNPTFLNAHHEFIINFADCFHKLIKVTKMKRIIFSFLLILIISAFSFSQSWNPYLSQGIISLAPLLPLQLNGTGVVSFNIGNSGSNEIPYYSGNPASNLKVVIVLSRGVPNVTPLNPTTALTTLGGTWASKFTWQYDMGTRTFTGNQNQILAGLSQGNITVQYKVIQNSPQNSPLNGFSATLTPPAYMSGINNTSDDQVSSYTFTRARDFGDAPAVYGSAEHLIDFDSRYRYMGTAVDHDTGYLASASANLDDITGVDDEDGVTLPSMMQGFPANIIIKVTGGPGYINA